MNTVIIIPTIDPGEGICQLVEELRVLGFCRFIIVDDGSSESRDPLFAKLERGGARVLHHAANLGKGAAIKTALAAMVRLFPGATHAITVDGDGQHLPADVKRVSLAAEENCGHIVIGTRNLKGRNVPLRSRLGNAFSSAYFKLDTGFTCPDTQTGLRAIPASLIPFALSVEGSRYEYEMNLLTTAVKKGIPLEMVPIETVYEDNNAGSHFSPVQDSVRIYRQLIRFAGSSLTCSLIDLALFAFVTALLNLEVAAMVALATVTARMASGVLNFTLNRTWSFADTGSGDGDARMQATRYAILFFAQMAASASLVTLLSWLPLPLVGVKIAIDGTLFVASYFIQRNWVFEHAARTRAFVMKGGAHEENASRNSFPAV